MTTDQKRRELSTAIKARQSVTFTYNSKQREGNPHTLGYLFTKNPTDSEYAIRMYQTDGPSSSQSIITPIEKDTEGENFRLFHIEDIDNIEKQTTVFTPHPQFQTKDEAFNWKIKGDYRTIEVSTSEK